jgi:hypothetical protein
LLKIYLFFFSLKIKKCNYFVFFFQLGLIWGEIKGRIRKSIKWSLEFSLKRKVIEPDLEWGWKIEILERERRIIEIVIWGEGCFDNYREFETCWITLRRG